MIKITKSDQHHHSDQGWLSTYWHFSFADYSDPENTNFGSLRVFNDDIVQPGKGFDFHPHRDMEIVTYVIDGELEHKDNQGNHGVIQQGEIQRMSAGSGILHSEYNHSTEKPLRLLQMWIFANKRGLKPSWEQQKFDRKDSMDKLLPVIVPEGAKDGAALHIHQDAKFYVSTLSAGKHVGLDLGLGKKAYVFVIEGRISLNGQNMETRGSARIENEDNISIKAEKQTEFLVIEMAEKYAINN